MDYYDGHWLEDLPLEEIGVLGLTYQAGAHHDRLEALSLDGPELAVGGGRDRGRPLTVVEDGQLAQHLGPGQCRQVLAFAGHLHAALCGTRNKKHRRKSGGTP